MWERRDERWSGILATSCIIAKNATVLKQKPTPLSPYAIRSTKGCRYLPCTSHSSNRQSTSLLQTLFLRATDMEDFSRTIELQPDASEAQLGSQPTEIGENSNRAAFANDLGRWAVESRVVHLQHGTYQGKAATLISFEFIFRYSTAPNSFSRLGSADISISFEPHRTTCSNSVVGATGPTVVCFCPKLLQGH